MAISPLEFTFIRSLMASRSGVVLTENQKYLAESRLLPLVREQKLSMVSQLIQKLQSGNGNGLADQAVDALLPKETAFFRDAHAFQLLRSRIIPVLEGQRFRTQKLTIWCAGCSSGQEAYSIAMLLQTYFSHLSSWDVQIIATDLSQEALNIAQEGRYNEIEVNRGLPPHLAKQCLRQEGTTFFVKDDVRKMVHFEPHNLIGEWGGLNDVDVVLLRNVLSHLSVPAKRAVLAKLKQVLKPDGYLLLGARETTTDIDPTYRLVPTEGSVYYQTQATPTHV